MHDSAPKRAYAGRRSGTAARGADDRVRAADGPGSRAGVIVLDVLDAAAVRRWTDVAVEQLEAHRAEIDGLNVFPVPDGDTGTNMLTTLLAGRAALPHEPADAGDGADGHSADHVLGALAAGAAVGAVGNSGFILSQILRGLAEAATTAGRWDGPALAAGLASGAAYGRHAVVTPVDGTILSVALAAAEQAGASADGSLDDVVVAAVRAADEAVGRTPQQLAQLAEAGVVDAGGRGLVVLLDALARTVTGRSALLDGGGPTTVPARGGTVVDRDHIDEPPDDDDGLKYEVQYLLNAPDPAVDELRRTLSELGDSVAVVSTGTQTWKVHVHVDDIGAAVEAGLRAGRPSAISVVDFAEQNRRAAQPAGTPRGSAVLAVAPGAGLTHLFESEGVHVVEGSSTGEGGGDAPSTADVVAAITATGARDVVLLPNASQVTGVAEAAAAQLRGRRVRVAVVPTRSPVQGLAAIAVHDAGRRFDDDVVAMAEAAAATRFAEVTVARTQALTAVGICQPGDVLGLIDGEVVHIGRGMLAVAFGLVDRLLGVGAELMTILVGQDAPRRAGELVEAHVRGRAPLTDVVVYSGGQPDHPLIIGVE